MSKRTMKSGCIGFAACALFACSAAEDGLDASPEVAVEGEMNEEGAATTVPRITNEDELNRIASVDLPNNTTVSFFENDPGVITITEFGRIGNEPVLEGTSTDNAVQVYEQLSGAKAPAALAAAYERAKELRGEPPALEAAAVDDGEAIEDEGQASIDDVRAQGIGRRTQALVDDSWFWSRFCPSLQSGYYRWKYWRHKTQDARFQLDDVWGAESNVMSLQGSIHADFRNRVWWRWSGATRVDIPEGYYYSYRISTGSDIDFDIKADISNANGDVYDACAHGRK